MLFLNLIQLPLIISKIRKSTALAIEVGVLADSL
jgi:hypothetical protein